MVDGCDIIDIINIYMKIMQVYFQQEDGPSDGPSVTVVSHDNQAHSWDHILTIVWSQVFTGSFSDI